MGRPTDYKEGYAEQAYKLALIGADDKDLAVYFDVDERTINNWKDAHLEFFQSIKEGKELSNYEVEKSLRDKAMGFEKQIEKTEITKDGIQSITTKQYFPPDTAAAIFWLKNRNPTKWQDKKGVDHTSGGEPIDLGGIISKFIGNNDGDK